MKQVVLGLLFCLFCSLSRADTLIILERSGTLAFTQTLIQGLQKKQLPEDVHIGYVDAFYASLDLDKRARAVEIYKSSILLSAGIDESTVIDRVISQGSAPARFLENHPELFSQAERYFTHIAWQPTTGTLIPSDINIIENIHHLTTLFPNKAHLLLIGNSNTSANELVKIKTDVEATFPSLKRVSNIDYQNVTEEVDELARNTKDMVALITHPPEIQSELVSLKWLQAQSIPVLFLFANHLDFEAHKTVGGLVVDPLKIADIIKTLANNQPVLPAQHNVTTALYHAAALEKYDVNPDTYSAQYHIIGEKSYTQTQVQVFVLSALIGFIVILLLYIQTRFKNMALLRERATDAEEANNAKDTLIANISHELRTPLNAINLAFYSLGQHQHNADSPLIAAGQRSTAHLKTIVDNVLDYHQTSIKAMHVDIDWVNKTDILDAIKLHQHAAQAKSLTFGIQGYESLPTWLYTDEKLVMQILHNILSNALKFTESGTVTLTFSHTAEQLSIAVSDTGIGMSPSTVDDLFVPFKQANLSIRKKYQGTGLGMALCHNLITLLDGHIDVQSALGEGTTFTVSIPMTFQKTATQQVNIPSASKPQTALNLKLLIVEDEPINRELMSYALTDKVKHVSAVASAQAALAFVATHEVDVVLSDIQMPDIDGMELLSLLRQQLPDLPVIAITGNALHHEQQLYSELGFNAVLAKPFNLDELMEVLQVQFQIETS